jgi:hypothetical protein
MKAPINSILAAVGGCVALALAAATASPALAGGSGYGNNGNHNCGCQPHQPNHQMEKIKVNVNVYAMANANASARSQSQASTQAATFIGGGGGGGSSIGPAPVGLIQNLSVGGDVRKTAYEAERTKITKVVIETVCIDDKLVPHPGSQVTPDRDIDDAYDGELFRCIAGTHMRVTIADYQGEVSFDHGWTMDCDKGQALYHSPGGHVECRAQIPARDCNERSLLRRFGAGVKILTMITKERYTAYKEETDEASSVGSMTIDGGVGGMVY